MLTRSFQGFLLVSALALSTGPALAQSVPGVTATEVKLGQFNPLSGPVSAYGIFSKTSGAYFKKVNDEGGVAGRKINLLTMDDGYAPPKAVEVTRRLVERERVLAMFGSIGTAQNIAVRDYLYEKGVPMLFAGIGVDIWGSPEKAKWSTMWSPNHKIESGAYARQILKTKPNAKIAILAANDEGGRGLVAGFKEGLGDKKNLVVAEATYEQADPTVDSQILALKNSGADVLVNFASPRTASQAIRKAGELGWKPDQYLFSFAASIERVFKPAGIDNAVGIVTATYLKDPASPEWKDDPGVKAYLATLKRYAPDANPTDPTAIQGYCAAELTTHILREVGKDLNRDSLIKQTKSVKGVQLSMVLPGILVDTSRPEPSGLHEVRLQKFDGTQFRLIN